VSTRYTVSEKLLHRAEQTIPLGSQTFSKSRVQFPFGVSPFFIQRAEGSRVWDVDGNEYVDFINSLAAVTLGYNDRDVTAAVHSQLKEGVIFSLPHPLEMQVAEKIVEAVPCAEMVRFGKNGSDATSGAIRLARAYTGRDRVAVCGYHGWQDWYIGSTSRWRGVPNSVRALTHAFPYNDLGALDLLLKKYPSEFAGIILEPMNVTDPLPGYLAGVRDLARAHGAVLVFDETITGFRYALGGAQEFFDVIPDLATFGKGMANGYPVSAVVGRTEIMKLMEEIFFSFTFGGETLSLAAAAATLDKLRRAPVIETLRIRGEKLISAVRTLINRHDLGKWLRISGHPSWSFLSLGDAPGCSSLESKTLLMQELLARGILWYGTHNMSFAHSEADIDRLIGAYDEAFPLLRRAIKTGRPRDFLKCEPLQPLFKVR
jgi:glutamate-1-semialdehyde 2,1-aminomutase